MDFCLAVNHDVDEVHVDMEQVKGFDSLKALVHERCGIDGNLSAHVPGRMSESLLYRNVRKLRAALSKKGAAGAGKPDAVCFLGIFSLIALKDRSVFRIDGKQHARSRHGHQKIASDNKRFFVCKSQLFSAR